MCINRNVRSTPVIGIPDSFKGECAKRLQVIPGAYLSDNKSSTPCFHRFPDPERLRRTRFAHGFLSLITVGAAMAGSIIADIVVIRKENSNSKLLSKEHEGLSKNHDSLSKEHTNLSEKKYCRTQAFARKK